MNGTEIQMPERVVTKFHRRAGGELAETAFIVTKQPPDKWLRSVGDASPSKPEMGIFQPGNRTGLCPPANRLSRIPLIRRKLQMIDPPFGRSSHGLQAMVSFSSADRRSRSAVNRHLVSRMDAVASPTSKRVWFVPNLTAIRPQGAGNQGAASWTKRKAETARVGWVDRDECGSLGRVHPERATGLFVAETRQVLFERPEITEILIRHATQLERPLPQASRQKFAVPGVSDQLRCIAGRPVLKAIATARTLSLFLNAARPEAPGATPFAPTANAVAVVASDIDVDQKKIKRDAFCRIVPFADARSLIDAAMDASGSPARPEPMNSVAFGFRDSKLTSCEVVTEQSHSLAACLAV